MSDSFPIPPRPIVMSSTSASALERARDAMRRADWGEAFGIAMDVLEKQPNLPQAKAVLGTVLAVRRQWQAALGLFEEALVAFPDNSDWQARRAGCLRELFRPDESVAAATRSCELDPGNANFLLNLGFSLIDTGDLTTARACFVKAIGLAPTSGECHFGLAQLLLRQGEYRIGWQEYEWRNRCDMAKDTMPELTSMEWNGIDLGVPEAILIIIGDQGYGDTIMFSRLLEKARSIWTGKIILGVSVELRPLFLDCPHVDEVRATWDMMPRHTCHCRLSSLASILGICSDLRYNPLEYDWLAQDPIDFDVSDHTVPCIGITWRGRAAHASDLRRSMPVGEIMTAMIGAPNAQWVCLQADCTVEEQLLLLQSFPSMIFPKLDNWAQTAYLLEQVDSVIAVDTAVAHLAGALEVPTTVLLYHPAEWRWEQSHLYSSVKQLRQRAAGDWSEVLHTLRERLENDNL